MSRIKQILSNAASYLETNGWYQGGAYGPGKSACAYGAACEVNRLLFGSGREWKDVCNAMDVLGNHLQLKPDSLGGIPKWNDAPERTREEVITALRAAAEAQCDECETGECG